jgi:hypothetical protein
MNKKNENYWNTYQMVNDWTKFSDSKAGILVTGYGVILTIIYSNAKEVYSGISSSCTVLMLSSICILLSIISIYYAFQCLNPRLKNNNPKSVLYFGHIAKNKNYNAYFKHSEDVFNDENNTSEQLAEQVYVNSTIAWKKFRNVSLSIRFFFASILFLIAILIINFFKL